MQIAHVQTHVIADAPDTIQLPFITRILSCFRVIFANEVSKRRRPCKGWRFIS